MTHYDNPEKKLYEADKALNEIETVIHYCERTGGRGAWGFVSEDTLRESMMALQHEVESIRKEIDQ